MQREIGTAVQRIPRVRPPLTLDSEESLTVVCWLWKGWRPLYGPQHVNALSRMLARHLRAPYSLICVTDSPKGIECETTPLWTWPDVKTAPGAPNCYRRLRLFAPDAAKTFGPRILSIDLDTVIFREITPLITWHPFRIVRGFTAPYNGSMWLLRAGARPAVYTEFSAAEARRARIRPDGREWLGSDQAWLAHKLPGEPVWTADDGVHLFHELFLRGFTAPAAPRIIFFPGLVKPWDERMKRDFPDIYSEYAQYL